MMRVILLEAYDVYPITFLVLTLPCDTFDTRVGSTPSTQSRNTPFLWTRQLLNDFLEIRTMIANPSLLFQIDSSKPLYLETDASELGFGAMLYQEDTEGSTTIVKPIVYHAREWQSPTFRGTRVNPGNALRRELKALQLSILHFDKILTNRPFNIITNNILRSSSGAKCIPKGISQNAQQSCCSSEFRINSFTSWFASENPKNVRNRLSWNSLWENVCLVNTSNRLKPVAKKFCLCIPTFCPSVNRNTMTYKYSRGFAHFCTRTFRQSSTSRRFNGIRLNIIATRLTFTDVLLP